MPLPLVHPHPHHDAPSLPFTTLGGEKEPLASVPSVPCLRLLGPPVEINSLYKGIDLYTSFTLARFEKLEIESFDGGNDFSQTPSHFNQPDNHALCKNLKPIEQVLKDASTKKEDIDDVVLVGGSSRMSKVQPLLKDIFNGINPTRSPIRALPSLRIEGH
ncbi:ATPase with role in protein import into the ER [Tulasnella sp. 424]|nr:ATPase with role in protein import into the ER [Tulasnella sp. 424]